MAKDNKVRNGVFIVLGLLALLSISLVSFSVTSPTNADAFYDLISIKQDNIKIGEKLIVTGTVTSPTGGTFYAEAGIIEQSRQPLSLVATRSVCDGKTQFAGRTITLAPGESQTIEFQISDYGVTGTYDIVAGIYRGCSANLGSSQIVYEEQVFAQALTVNPGEVVTSTNPPGGAIAFTRIDGSPEAGSTVTMVGSFEATGDGRYYIEGGFENNNQPLSIVDVSSSRSKCDGSIFYAGEWVDLKEGDIAKVQLTMKNPEQPGKYIAKLYATNGCETGAGNVIYFDGKAKTVSVVETTATGGSTAGGSETTLNICEQGDIKEASCSTVKASSSGTISYTCADNKWHLNGGVCRPITGETLVLPINSQADCKIYQEFVDGECKTRLGQVFTNKGLSAFTKDNPVATILIILVFLGIVAFVTDRVTKGKKK